MNSTKTTKTDGEYRVRLFVDGAYQAGADYYTNDKQDAIDTAKHMLNGGISDKTTDFAIAEQQDYNEDMGLDNNNNMVMYDVCNDYSLDIMTTDFNPALYRTKSHQLGTLYIHRACNEIHYLLAAPGLEGQYI